MSSQLVSLRLDQDLHAVLVAAAEGHEAGLSGFVRSLIAAAVDPHVSAPIAGPDAEAIARASQAVAEAERVLSATRKTVDQMRAGLDAARAQKDDLLKSREPLTLAAKAKGDAAAQAALDEIASKLRPVDLEISDYTSALAAAEREHNAAASALRRAKADHGLIVAQQIRAEIIACSREFDAAISAAVDALRKREALRVRFVKTGADLENIKSNRLLSRTRLNRALGRLGLGSFADLPGAQGSNYDTLAESDAKILGDLRRREPKEEAA